MELNELLKLAEEWARREEVYELIKNANVRSEERIIKIKERFKEIESMRREVIEIKERVIANLDYWVEEAKRGLEAKGFQVHFAENAEDARRKFKEIVGDNKVMASKSLTAWEVGINEFENVFETDIGMFILSILKDSPVHNTAPAIHLSRRDALNALKKIGVEVESDDPKDLVRAIASYLREKYCETEYGMVGANAVATEGAVVNVEGEGNVRLVASLSKTLIVVGGIEKIVPTVVDAVKTSLIQAAFAGRYPIQINVIAGPTATSDIERILVRGAQGPHEVHMILIDNGRRRVVNTSLKEFLKCVRCGRCLLNCPVWQRFPKWGEVYRGPMGIGWNGIVKGREAMIVQQSLCTRCEKCKEVCPMEINIVGSFERAMLEA